MYRQIPPNTPGKILIRGFNRGYLCCLRQLRSEDLHFISHRAVLVAELCPLSRGSMSDHEREVKQAEVRIASSSGPSPLGRLMGRRSRRESNQPLFFEVGVVTRPSCLCLHSLVMGVACHSCSPLSLVTKRCRALFIAALMSPPSRSSSEQLLFPSEMVRAEGGANPRHLRMHGTPGNWLTA